MNTATRSTFPSRLYIAWLLVQGQVYPLLWVFLVAPGSVALPCLVGPEEGCPPPPRDFLDFVGGWGMLTIGIVGSLIALCVSVGRVDELVHADSKKLV